MIKYYAFRTRNTKTYLGGTDFGDHSPRYASKYITPKIFSGLELKTEIVRRRIDLERFEIVPVVSANGILCSGSPYEGFPPELEEVSL